MSSLNTELQRGADTRGLDYAALTGLSRSRWGGGSAGSGGRAAPGAARCNSGSLPGSNPGRTAQSAAGRGPAGTGARLLIGRWLCLGAERPRRGVRGGRRARAGPAHTLVTAGFAEPHGAKRARRLSRTAMASGLAGRSQRAAIARK